MMWKIFLEGGCEDFATELGEMKLIKGVDGYLSAVYSAQLHINGVPQEGLACVWPIQFAARFQLWRISHPSVGEDRFYFSPRR